jgi:hypothetical protein
LAVGVVSEVADCADGEAGARVEDAAGFVLDGLESLDAAEASEPLKAFDCFSRNDGMLGDAGDGVWLVMPPSVEGWGWSAQRDCC